MAEVCNRATGILIAPSWLERPGCERTAGLPDPCHGFFAPRRPVVKGQAAPRAEGRGSGVVDPAGV